MTIANQGTPVLDRKKREPIFGIKVHVPHLELKSNICDQMLREVVRTDKWSVAHVVMNPGAFSLLHKHEKMAEVYVITRGNGQLLIGMDLHQVSAGSVFLIPAGVQHHIINTGATSLEHLVLASPAFDPADVKILKHDPVPEHVTLMPIIRSPTSESFVECFDGAMIMAYEFPELDLSFAFGWVINDPTRRKKPHFHGLTTEYIYIVEGVGTVEVGGELEAVKAGDWMRIDPNMPHAIFNHNDQYLVALCMCSPRFTMADVQYPSAEVAEAAEVKA